MAEDQQKPVAEAPSTAEVAVVAEEKPVAAEDAAPPAAKEAEPEGEKLAAPAEEAKAVEAEKAKAVEAEKAKAVEAEKAKAVEAEKVAQKKALDELKALIQEALNKHEFTAPPPAKEAEKAAAAPAAEEAEKAEVVAVEKTAATEEAEKAEVAVTEGEPPKAEESEKTAESEPALVAVVEEVVEKLTVVADDGAKTVEAIEETVVSVSATPVAESEAPPAAAEEVKEEEAEVPPPVPSEPEEVFIFGIPLLGDEKSDVILLKFLRARDFKVKEAFSMIKSTVWWRKEFGIEAILEEDLGNELGKVVFMHGTDKEGHPVCYNVYGEFQNKELYQSTFSDEEKRTKFLKWRIQFLEKSIRKLDFSPTGINTIVQVNDLRNSPGPAKRELRQATNQALSLLQDNYPEFVFKQVFINVPWWYLAFNRMISPFLTQRTKSKFVFAGPSKTAETLFRYIAPEQVPVQYGGLSREGEQEFTPADSVTEVTIKPASKHSVEFPVTEAGLVVWEVRVIGWEVSYGAEFVPSAEDGYTVIVQKARKVGPTDEPVITNSFKVGEPGKIVLTFDNQTSVTMGSIPSKPKERMRHRFAKEMDVAMMSFG